MREECGIAAVYGSRQASGLTALMLFALQHRGQESCGVAAFDGTVITIEKQLGLVSNTLLTDPTKLPLGERVIGQVRYSTAGGTGLQNAQPICANTKFGQVAVAHNGNITNALILRRALEGSGSIFSTTSDTEVVLHLVAKSEEKNLRAAIAGALRELQGAFSFAFLTKNEIMLARDPLGFRPLSVGKLPSGAWAAASETTAFTQVGAEYRFDVEPGEIVTLTGDTEPLRERFAEKAAPRYCIFEHVYFSYPSSWVFGRLVFDSRRRLGSELALEYPPPAGTDCVLAVPNSATDQGMAYAATSGVAFARALLRRDHSTRSFIAPTEELRDATVEMKLDVIVELIRGKVVVLVDDSSVRGRTLQRLIAKLKSPAVGIREVHVRIASPPVSHPCYFGVDTPTKEELLASRGDVEFARQYTGADSFAYLSHDGLLRAVGLKSCCDACYTGSYPLIPADLQLVQLT